MRILHTSDWHLGISHGATSRGPDHDYFLGWLEVQLAERAIDALIVAGDVFDSMQPSADALRRYYRFLARLADTGVVQVVVVGGNHDSASSLDAPADVLSTLSVHVVGGIGGSEASWKRCLIPLRDRAGIVGAVALAVPYVHEFRLGVRTTDLDTQAVRNEFETRFAAVYARLADLAEAQWPGLPLVATGHLTLGAAKRDDYPVEIHQVGQIDGLPVSVLDQRIQYSALGHIHRCYPVGSERRAWYCGSPVAFTLREAATPRNVLQVDVDPAPRGTATVTAVQVPSPRGLMELRAAPEDLIGQVRRLQWPEQLPPLLFCRAVTDTWAGDLESRLLDALSSFPEGARPALAELKQERETPLAVVADEVPTVALSELSPVDVFASLCRSVGRTDTDRMQSAFASLSSATDDDFAAMLSAARGEQP